MLWSFGRPEHHGDGGQIPEGRDKWRWNGAADSYSGQGEDDKTLKNPNAFYEKEYSLHENTLFLWGINREYL